MPARLNGRTKSRTSSGSGMAEDPAHFGVDLLFGPIRMLTTQPRRFHLARGPVKSLREPQPALTGHSAEDGDLLRASLLIRQHANNMCGSVQPSKPLRSADF